MRHELARHSILLASAVLTAAIVHGQTAELAKLVASDGQLGDAFGSFVSISGDRVFVGVPMGEVGVGTGGGSAYVFERDGAGAWLEVAELEASDAALNDVFGFSVCVDGDRAIVGAGGDDDLGDTSGAAYVFERNATGTWVEVAKLHASDGAAGDDFGTSVAVSGDRALVGAKGDDDLGQSSGSAYVFERSAAGAWQEVAKLNAADGAAGDQFGHQLALDGDLALVGAWLHDEGAMDSGGAYVFERGSTGGWTQAAELVASDAASGDNLGIGVSLSGERALVGAYGDDSFAGSAYVFVRSGTAWIEETKLTASNRAPFLYFGTSVAIEDSRALVGSTTNEFPFPTRLTPAFVFERSPLGSWSETALLLPSDTELRDAFGYPVALSGDRGLVGAPFDDDLGLLSGSAYVFDLAPLSSTVTQISLSSGGMQPLELDAGHLHAGEAFVLLGSMSGTSPGIPLAGGLVLPLNPDRYFLRTLELPNRPPLSGARGSLNAYGHADAAFTLAPLDFAIAGITVHHAFVTLGSVAAATSSGSFPAPAPALATFASNPFPLLLVP